MVWVISDSFHVGLDSQKYWTNLDLEKGCPFELDSFKGNTRLKAVGHTAWQNIEACVGAMRLKNARITYRDWTFASKQSKIIKSLPKSPKKIGPPK